MSAVKMIGTLILHKSNKDGRELAMAMLIK